MQKASPIFLPRLFGVMFGLIAGFYLESALAQDTIKRIATRGQVNVGYVEDLPPFSFHDNKGRPVGYSIDLCRFIVEKVMQEVGQPGLRIRYIPVAPDQWERVVSSGGLDLWCASASDTPDRRKTMAFSSPVFVTGVKFMVRAKDKMTSAQQLRGQTVVVMGRTTAEPAVNAFSAKNVLALRVSRALSAEAGLSQLLLGQAAAFALDEVLLLDQRAQQLTPSDYVLLPDALSTELIAIAFARDDPGMQRIVEQALALQVRSGRADALYDQWFVKPYAGARAGLNLPMSPELKAAFARLR